MSTYIKTMQISGESVLVFSLGRWFGTLVFEKGALQTIEEKFIGPDLWIGVDPFFYSEKVFQFDFDYKQKDIN